ncbi:MAG: PIN domain-containing protein [Nanoarchaeota archaeon]
MLDSLVIEANIIFAALIKRSDNFKLIKLLPELGIRLYSPQFVFEEIKNREEKILRFSKLDAFELRWLLNDLFKSIETTPKSKYESFLADASSIFPKHSKDTPYFALALKLSIPLWSNEKLHKKQSKVEVYSTLELLKEFGFKL